jgi:hypothetical protein
MSLLERIKKLEEAVNSQSITPAAQQEAKEQFLARMNRYITYWWENPTADCENESPASLFARKLAFATSESEIKEVVEEIKALANRAAASRHEIGAKSGVNTH